IRRDQLTRASCRPLSLPRRISDATLTTAPPSKWPGGIDMFNHRSRGASVLGVLPVMMVGTLSAGCVISGAEGRYVDRDEKRFSLEKDVKPDVKVSTRDGAVEIRPWDRAEVLVVIEKHALSKQAADAMKILTSQDGNHVQVDATMHSEDGLSRLFL